MQAHLPILIGAMTPAGLQRAARIADGLNPIAVSADVLRGLTNGFRAAAEALGRDPAGLMVVARANVPITSEPLGSDRPYLGGSPAQIAADLAALEGTGVDHVFFSSGAPTEIEREVDLFAELIQLARG